MTDALTPGTPEAIAKDLLDKLTDSWVGGHNFNYCDDLRTRIAQAIHKERQNVSQEIELLRRDLKAAKIEAANGKEAMDLCRWINRHHPTVLTRAILSFKPESNS